MLRLASTSLKTKAIKATGWYTAVRIWTQVLSWGVSLLLARVYLSPEDFGLFGLALSMIAILELFQEMGLGAAIIQKQNISRSQVNGIFVVIFSIGVVLLVCSFVAGNIAAWFFDEPRLVWLVRVLGFMFLLNAVGTVPYSLLSKELDFRRRSLSEAMSVTLSAGVSIYLAYQGFGFWALVGGQLFRAAVKNIGFCVLVGWHPSLDVSFVGLKDTLKFGLHISGASGLKTLSGIVNTMIVAKILGSGALGFYSMATTLGTNPLHKLFTSVINQLSLPIFSKLQNDVPHLGKYFLKISKYLALIALPSQVGMFLIGADLILVLLTEKWMPILELFQYFCIGGIFYILPLPSSPVLTARGKPRIVFWFQALFAVIMGVGYLLGAQFGLGGIGLAWFLTFPTLRAFLLLLSLKELNLSPLDYFKNIQEPILATGLMTFAVFCARDFGLMGADSIVRLISMVIIGAGVYAVSLMVLDRRLVPEFKDIASEMFSRARV